MITANVYGTVEAPVSRGFSFIEIWMVGIQITILLALFEYAFILELTRTSHPASGKVTQVQGPSGAGLTKQNNNPEIERKFKLMDRYTEIGSAAFFIIFNICYWMIATMK